MTNAINSRLPVVNGIVLIIALVICVLNLLVDIAYAFIDPASRALRLSKRRKQKTWRCWQRLRAKGRGRV